MKPAIGDIVVVTVKTTFADIPVEFRIFEVLNEANQIYALTAQKRVCVGQLMADGNYGSKWVIRGQHIDLLSL